MFDLFSQPPEPTGEELKIQGIQRAIEHAEQKTPTWGELAYTQFTQYIKMVDKFKTEDVRVYAEQNGLPMPPSKRAWGAITLRAQKAGLIKSIGFISVDNPKAHKAHAVLWGVIHQNN